MRDTKTVAGICSLVLMVGTIQATEPPVSPIILPEVIQPAQPVPPAVVVPPGSPVVLAPDSLYVIQSSVECLVFAANDNGVLKVTRDAGPLRIKGRFAEKPYEVQTKNFTGKFLYIVEAGKAGQDSLIVVPVGAKVETEAKRVAFLVGQLPIPPPEPKPDDPKPVVTSFRVILGYESGQTMTQAQTNVMYGGVVESYLNASCTGGKAGWRRRDKDADGDADPTMAALWSAVKPKVTATPFIAVEINGKVEILPLESTPTAQVEKLKTLNGGK